MLDSSRRHIPGDSDTSVRFYLGVIFLSYRVLAPYWLIPFHLLVRQSRVVGKSILDGGPYRTCGSQRKGLLEILVQRERRPPSP